MHICVFTMGNAAMRKASQAENPADDAAFPDLESGQSGSMESVVRLWILGNTYLSQVTCLTEV